MNTNHWLRKNFTKYKELTKQERDALCNFILIWTIFETNLIEKNSSINSIREFVTVWVAEKKLKNNLFLNEFKVFKDVFLPNGELSHVTGLVTLFVPDYNGMSIVYPILKANDQDVEERLLALLLMISGMRYLLFKDGNLKNTIYEKFICIDTANSVLTTLLNKAKFNVRDTYGDVIYLLQNHPDKWKKASATSE